MITIRYAIPPDLIVFSMGSVTFVLEHHLDTPRIPYTITEVGGLKQKINNINEWLGLKTRARYNLELLHDLANAFIMGRESSYCQADLEQCAELVFEHARVMLFKDGLAGRYAEICDIECMSLDEIKHRLGRAAHMDVSQERVRRFMRVCQKNGWADLADGWARYLEESVEERTVDMVQAPIVDDTIKRSIGRLVASKFTKDKDYTQTVETIQQQHLLRENNNVPGTFR